LSTTLKSVSWPTAQIIRDVAELRNLEGQPGKNMYVVGGATLVASLLNEDLIDELRLIVHAAHWYDGGSRSARGSRSPAQRCGLSVGA
jgi:dihydrofolate reductase